MGDVQMQGQRVRLEGRRSDVCLYQIFSTCNETLPLRPKTEHTLIPFFPPFAGLLFGEESSFVFATFDDLVLLGAVSPASAAVRFVPSE